MPASSLCALVRLVVSGGQTGVDRAAVDVAIACGVPYGGWVPSGGWAEDLTVPPCLLASYPAFEPTPSRDPAARTERNVLLADVTMLVTFGDTVSPGTRLTRQLARRHGAELVVVDLEASARDDTLVASAARWRRGIALNVAGPRESERLGAYAETRRFLEHHARLLFA